VDIRHSSNLLLLLALGLSSFAFLWNPLGFPPLRYEDGTYIGRGMHALVAQTPQEGKFYDHPYFGQLFLAGIFWLIGYPDLVHPSAVGDVLMSVEMLWLVPKVFIGILGIIDTFLIYKISEHRYGARVGFIASILFALMSISLLRTVYLESLQLPLILTSIFFALNTTIPKTNDNAKKNHSNVLISGIFMGLAIFTKIPAFIMIPLVVFIILTSHNKKLTALSLWIIPVVLIPSIWPAYAISHEQFDYWLNGIYWQTHRQSTGTPLEADRQATLANSIIKNFLKMPVLFVLGFSGLSFAAVKRDFFLLLWAIPILGFLYFIGFASEFHLIPVLPLLCISSARFIDGLSNTITHRSIRKLSPYFIISAIAIFGLMNVIIQITTNGNDDKFAASAFVTRYLNDNKDSNITMIATHVYSWIPRYVFHLGDDYRIPEIDPIEIGPKINKSLFVVDRTFKSIMSGNDEIGERLRKVFYTYTKYNTTTVTVGGNNIILPKADSSYINLTQDNGTNLLGGEYNWKLRGNGQLSHADGILKILVKTNGTEKVSRNAILRTQLNNLTETPLVLSLLYSSKSPEGNDRFSVEIKDTDSQKRYFRSLLIDTSGNETSQLFILPGEIVGKTTELRFGLTTNTPGEHTLILKKVNINYEM
jgi:Dolichyl-phosphate-mannose-protein mannosyltransferase